MSVYETRAGRVERVEDELNAIELELGRRRLRKFIEVFWHIVEPGVQFRSNWHIDLVCEELEAITFGQNTEGLIINIPPGTMKSLCVNVFWPAWEWAADASRCYLTTSYSDALSIRDNKKMRDLVMSDLYRNSYRVFLAPDQKAKVNFSNTEKGWRVASSIRGQGTGLHPDRIIIDDPLTARQAESEVERETVKDWYTSTISTRGASRGCVTVLVMQRLHQEDLSGFLSTEIGGMRHLRIPMRYETPKPPGPNRPKGYYPPDPRDPRRKDGDLLWPTLFDETKVTRLTRTLGAYGAAGQLQQRPSPEGGGLFKRVWFDYVDERPARESVLVSARGWDTAATEGGGDYTAGCLISRARDGVYFIEHVRRGQWSPAHVDEAFLEMRDLDGRQVRVREDQEPGASGKGATFNRAKLLVGSDYLGVNPSGDKVTRAGPLRAAAENGLVKIVRGEWNHDFLDELENFPFGKHDDQVDAASCAFNDVATAFGAEASASPGSVEKGEGARAGFGSPALVTDRGDVDDEDNDGGGSYPHRRHRFGN